MSNDPFRTHSVGVTAPAVAAFAITPSNSVNLSQPIRAVTIGAVAGGALSFVSSRDGQTYTTETLPQGTYPLFAQRILATGTTAAQLTGWV